MQPQTEAEVVSRSGPADGSAFRPDVEGLRGLAVLLVVLFHAGLPVAGGYVGVDVFFVISGYLITGLLVREHERSGRVSLSRFYARRIRRLLPAAAVVLVASLAAAWALVGLLDRPEVMADGAAAALSVSNIRFALAEGDYFTAIAGPSPFLHFWSLSVEEQFYLVWPALLLLVGGGRRVRVAAVLGLVAAGSFAANLVLTDTSVGWAFYSLPTRAWQLAAGGLLAVAGDRFASPHRLVAALGGLVGWAGLAAVVAAGVLLTESTPYPGLAALAPTLGAAVLIATGTLRGGPGLVLASPPFRFLGRISYSLYLWHWPILVFAPLVAGTALGLEATTALAASAVLVAWASWRFVEEPFRRGRLALALGTRRALGSGVAAIAAVALLAGGLGYGSVRAIDEIGTAVRPTPGPTSPAPTPTASSPAASSRPSRGPTDLPTDGPTVPPPSPTPVETPAPLTWVSIPDFDPPDPIPLPADVAPSLADARTDTERLYRDRCAAQVDDTEPRSCVYGDPSGSFTIALVGDSHAGEWFPALEVLARQHGWKLVPYVKLSCPFIDLRVRHIELKREYTECAAWREKVIALLAAQPPDLTVVAMSHRGIFPWLAADVGVESESAGIARAVERIPGRHAVMIDTPRTSVEIPGCIAAHLDDVRACAITRDTAFTRLFGAREARVAELTGAGVIDLIPTVCPAMPCQVVRDGMIIYRDNHHLTETFSASLAPALESALRRYVPADR